MELITIDRGLCKKDGICKAVCPMQLLQVGEEGFPEMIPGAEKFCIACGHCQAVCPRSALTYAGVAPQECTPIDRNKAGNLENLENLENLIKGRRSIRKYKKGAVPHETLERLLDMVRWVPSARNGQPLHWLMVEDREKLDRLAGLVADWTRKNEHYSQMATAWDQGFDAIFRGAPHLAVAHASVDAVRPALDCVIATTTLDLAASAMGLGGCWAGVFIEAADSEPLREFLHLPEDHKVYGALMLGYPSFNYQRAPQRKAIKLSWL